MGIENDLRGHPEGYSAKDLRADIEAHEKAALDLLDWASQANDDPERVVTAGELLLVCGNLTRMSKAGLQSSRLLLALLERQEG